MSDYQYDPVWNTYRLEPDTRDFSLADVHGQSVAHVEGNAKNNLITGNDADNILNGMLGADTLKGGLGNDRYDIDSSDDVVIEEDGEGSLDLIIAHASYVLPDHVEVLELGGSDPINGTGNAGANDLFGNNSSNRLDGGNGNDRLFGRYGDDTLVGGSGADRLWGGMGDDTFLVDEDDEVLEDAGEGNDWVVASFSYTLGDHLENLKLSGSQALAGVGNSLDNQLIGAGGDDTLEGGSGNDTLSGGAGNDVLVGGDGRDTVVFAGIRENYIVTQNPDGSFTVVDTLPGGDGEDALTGIESIQFADFRLDLVAAPNPPSDLRLAGSTDDVSVVEGTTGIGALTADGSGITWSFDPTAEDGGDADGMFVIENGVIKLAAGKVLNYDGAQAPRSYTIHVVASDGHGGETKKTFTINVANDPSDDNRAPTGLTLSIHLNESATSVTVGTLSATDPDGDTLTYALVDENGSDISAASEFAIRPVTNGGGVIGYNLVTKAGIQVTADETREIRVKADDGKGGTTIQKFIVTIKDVPTPASHVPTDIGLSHAAVQEGAAGGTLVGFLSVTDQDSGDSFIFSLADERFEISADGRLLVRDGAKLDYEAAQAHQIRVMVADKAGKTYEKMFTIQVGDAVETQIGTKGSNALTGGIGSDRLFGFAGRDQLFGVDGDDMLYGGAGNDVLTGGVGKDVFVFDTKLNKTTNVDRVMDFRTQDDSVYLDNKYFTKLGPGSFSKPKMFKKDMFVEGRKTKDAEDRIVYDKKTGSLYYDPDGTGSKAQVKIATLTNKAILKYDDLFVI